MSMYKTGHRDYPSLSAYSSLVDKHGPESEQANAYLARFKDDESFIRQAEAIRCNFLSKDSDKKENT